jgi:hypothetical protein
VLEHVAAKVGERAKLESKRLLVISNFGVEPILLQEDLPRVETPLLRVLAGLDSAEEPSQESPEVQLVVDADETQRFVISKALAGDSFAVETLPGCGYTQTVVNVIANLAMAEKRVLVVTPRRQTLNELADRLSATGLAGLGVRSSATWFDLVAAISRHEKAEPVDYAAQLEKRESAKASAEEYFSALRAKNPDLGVSVSEILSTLARLSLMPHAPTASARISKSKLLQQKDNRLALELLNQAFELGEFTYGPQDTPWFGARFSDAEEVQNISELAAKLAASFEDLSDSMNSFVAKLNLRPAVNFESWGTYLQLASGISLTLDRFVEDVYERDLEPLLIATGPRTARSEMSGSDRRRLRKLAKEYLRPGMHVADLHVALSEIHEQKLLWNASVLEPSSPKLSAGVGDLQVRYQAFTADLNQIQSHLDSNAEATPLVRLPLRELGLALGKMAGDLLPLKNFAERAAVVSDLRDLGLGDVCREFSKLHVKREHIAVEFDQVFWQSALEFAVAKDSRILGYTAEKIEVLESDFRLADAELVRVGAASFAAKQSAAWHQALAKHSGQAAALKALLRTRSASVVEISTTAPDIAKLLTSVVLASPYELPSVIPGMKFDTVVILDAAGTNVAENLSAISRADQLIAFGDDAIASPFGFEIECNEKPIEIEASDRSVFEVARECFGGLTLRRSWRQNGQSLGRLINREFYQNRIEFEPTAGEYLGDSNFDLVQTRGLDAELEKTLSLVVDHARKHPEKSLMVGTASKGFADRLREELQKKITEQSELEEFFDAHGREKFEVATIAELSHRIADVVIFSLGVQHEGELLSHRYGRKFVANLLVSARDKITLVSSLAELPSEWPLAALFKDIFAHATPAAAMDSDDVADPMLADLALRLKKLGARVTLGFGENLPLVISYGNRAGVIQADWISLEKPLVERLRLYPALLEAMGWQLIRVHSFELFSDPQTLALRIAIAIGMPLSKSQPPLFDVRSKDDTDEGWGDSNSSNDMRLRADKPPHWS